MTTLFKCLIALTPGEEKVIRVAADIAEAGKNIGFGELPSVMIHELYEAVEQLKRENKVGSHKFGEGRIEDGLAPDIVVPKTTPNFADNLSTDERARRFKFAIAEYARYHREWLRQSTDLEAAQKNVARLEDEVLSARRRVGQLIGSLAYLDFLEALHWRYVEYPHES